MYIHTHINGSLSLWMGLWIIDSHDSFKTQIHSETKHHLSGGMQPLCFAVALGNIFVGKTEQKQTI